MINKPKYILVSANEITLLSKEINRLLESGYELYGNPSVSNSMGINYELVHYTQAVILTPVYNFENHGE